MIDAIKEIINIGMGEAADTLSRLVNNRVIIRVPEVRVMSFSEIYDYIRKELTSLGVYMSQNFGGTAYGKTILFYSRDCSVSLLQNILGRTVSNNTLTESEMATLNEIGNMIMGSCMACIANTLEIRLSFELPHVTMDTSTNYFHNLLDEMESSGRVIIVKNEMLIREADIRGYLFLLMEFKDFNMLIQKIEMATPDTVV